MAISRPGNAPVVRQQDGARSTAQDGVDAAERGKARVSSWGLQAPCSQGRVWDTPGCPDEQSLPGLPAPSLPSAAAPVPGHLCPNARASPALPPQRVSSLIRSANISSRIYIFP